MDTQNTRQNDTEGIVQYGTKNPEQHIAQPNTRNAKRIAKTLSFLPFGFGAKTIEIEGTTTQGLPSFNIVGMGARTVSEARDRVRSALKNSDFSFPSDKITINLAPADLEKEGTFLDLPIAINILILSGQLRPKDIRGAAFVGELSLDGSIKPVKGIINIVEKARAHRISTLFLPAKNYAQASVISGITLIPATSLIEIYQHLKSQLNLTKGLGTTKLAPTDADTDTDTGTGTGTGTASTMTQRAIAVKAPKKTSQTASTRAKQLIPTLDDIKGQTIAKRALVVAVAGRHNILFSGPPGTGKTMLARAALGLLPELSIDEQIAVTKLHAINTYTDGIITERPFRTPHHTSSLSSLIGGGPDASPGEISLAHLGVLFLDELPEYPKQYLEALRQPLEDRKITISRVKRKTTYPADFMLIATMNPCPCGYFGDKTHPCTCTELQIRNYQRKLSGPLLDRIDLFVDVSRPALTSLGKTATSEQKEQECAKTAIASALRAQKHRYEDDTTFNSSVPTQTIAKSFNLASSAKTFLDSAAAKLGLSARSYFKVVKVARTIADLEESPTIKPSHISETLTFRQK